MQFDVLELGRWYVIPNVQSAWKSSVLYIHEALLLVVVHILKEQVHILSLVLH